MNGIVIIIYIKTELPSNIVWDSNNFGVRFLSIRIFPIVLQSKPIENKSKIANVGGLILLNFISSVSLIIIFVKVEWYGVVCLK